MVLFENTHFIKQCLKMVKINKNLETVPNERATVKVY